MKTLTAIRWNDENEARHLEKHGLLFSFAAGVFTDPNRIEEADTRRDYDLPRYNVVGLVDGVCINVTFALQESEAVIISARSASRRERKRYGSRDDR